MQNDNKCSNFQLYTEKKSSKESQKKHCTNQENEFELDTRKLLKTTNSKTQKSANGSTESKLEPLHSEFLEINREPEQFMGKLKANVREGKLSYR